MIMNLPDSMIDSLDEGMKHNAYDFLEKLESISNVKEDPTFKYIKFEDVWKKIVSERPNPSRSNESYRESILPVLKKENLIRFNEDDQMSITVKGILKLAKFKGLPLENYSLFSEKNVEIESKKVNDYFVSNGLSPTQQMVHEKFKDKYGPKTIQQIIYYLQTVNKI